MSNLLVHTKRFSMRRDFQGVSKKLQRGTWEELKMSYLKANEKAAWYVFCLFLYLVSRKVGLAWLLSCVICIWWSCCNNPSKPACPGSLGFFQLSCLHRQSRAAAPDTRVFNPSISNHLHTIPMQGLSETEIAVRTLKKMGIVFQKDCPDNRRNLPLKIMTHVG